MKKNESYNDFVEKFKPKLTTDDCYTPPEVYERVLNWVKRNYNTDGMIILRPFKPGGSYQSDDYMGNCIVIDNPPFSILSQIIRFYNARNIKYFLFAPHLAVFSNRCEYTAVVTNNDVIYENGAQVKTAFVTNIFPDYEIICAADLREEIKDAQMKIKEPRKRSTYIYPKNIVTVSRLAKIVTGGVGLKIHRRNALKVSRLDSQVQHHKNIFGCGFIVSDETKRELEAADDSFIFELSDREKKIVQELGNDLRRSL